MNCKFCENPMRDLTKGLGLGRNYYCQKCGAHYYTPIISFLKNVFFESRWFTKKQWEDKYGHN